MITLPSKKAQSIIVLTIGIVVALVLIFNQSKVEQGRKSLNNIIAGEKISLPENPNWQQDLGSISNLNTNILNSSSSTDSSSSTNETLTDVVSRSLMSNYLMMKQGGKLDATTAQNIVDNSAKYVQAMQTEKVTVSGLNLIPDNGEKTVIEYGDRLGNILRLYKNQSKLNEMDIIKESVQSRNPDKIKDLEKIALIYMQIANDLKKMPVPNKFARAHIDVVNGLYGMSDSLTSMQSIFEDPMRGLTSMQSYQQSGTTYIKSIQAIVEFLIKNKISYKQGAGGYYLMHGI